MNFVTLFSRLETLLILFYTICIQVILASNVKHSTVKCSTQYKPSKQIESFLFECSVVVQTYDLKHLDCLNYDYRSLVVRSHGSSIIWHAWSLICTSNNAITVDVKFADGIVSKTYLNMTWRRKVVDFEIEATYTYYLQIFLPSFPQNQYKGDAVKYTFSSVQFPSETIDVLWFSFYLTANPLVIGVHWMEDTRDITLTGISEGGAIYIPCVSPSPLPITIRKTNTNNSTVLNYNSTKFGVLLSPTESISDVLGKYECFNPDYNSSSLSFNIVPLSSYNTTSVKLYSTDKNIFETKLAFISSQKWDLKELVMGTLDNLNFELQCQAKNPKITYAYDTSWDNQIECNSTYYTTFDVKRNQTFTTAVCISSQLKNRGSASYKCLDENNNVTHIWRLRNGPSNNLIFDVRLNIIQCFIEFYNYEHISFIQDSCYNPLTCKFMEQSLQNVKSRNIISYCSRIPSFRVEPCLTMKILQRGIYMCKTAQLKKTNYYSEIYYVGFDEKVYLGFKSQPPKNAIINIVYLGPSEQIMINNRPVVFSFYCEAHSFLFEEGIQWLFQYSNGTKHLIPAEYISNYLYQSPNRLEEYRNPSSSVNILVPDKTIRSIICAAPRLSILEINNSKEWELELVNISIFGDAIAPRFVDIESNFFFIIGENNKEIKCQAVGLPKPKIHWTALSGKKMSSENIIDLSLYSVLKFPTYYSTDEGDYKCTATNEVGNVSKIFSVHTSMSVSSVSVEQLAFILTGIIAVLILAFSVAFVWYTRKMKMKQSLEMKRILELLNGKLPNLEDENTSNPLQLPYDRKWELQKHSFCIDKTKILGCGEFGIVYKGSIAKLNIDVAFKSLKSQGNMAHLKSLVSELKLLLYIGKHNNIVELLGAYTQEIKKEIIYVAIEVCALGSLESHLRSNKGRFQKCPTLLSYTGEALNLGEENCMQCESSNFSVKSLLKWCSEISEAMDYLYSKRVVHRDLATRNILLTADWTAKLTDFGLSRKIYNSDQYVRKGQDPLPWRWLALESLLNKIFNVKTDVWAFGITMWEIFSLGETPYPGLSASLEFVKELENGLRNPKPKYASNELYDVMVACWNCEADERPSFASLGILFRNALRHPTFQVNVEDMEVYDANEGENIEYLELVEL